jgi:hypothetical protein
MVMLMVGVVIGGGWSGTGTNCMPSCIASFAAENRLRALPSSVTGRSGSDHWGDDAGDVDGGDGEIEGGWSGTGTNCMPILHRFVRRRKQENTSLPEMVMLMVVMMVVVS